MKIAICDDNSECNEKLNKMLQNYMRSSDIEKYDIHVYTSGDSLINGFSPHKYDFIFLDVEMPGTDGFNTAKMIRELDLDVDIVFITNLKEGVQRGFDYNAKGYLYKDVTDDQISEKMDKLISERLRSNKDALMKIKLIKGGSVILSLSGIQYFESSSHQISAVSENETHVFIDTITNLTSKLESKGFIRVNQSNLVNIDYIFNITGSSVTIRKGGKITVGRAYKQAIDSAFRKREAEKWRI